MRSAACHPRLIRSLILAALAVTLPACRLTPTEPPRATPTATRTATPPSVTASPIPPTTAPTDTPTASPTPPPTAPSAPFEESRCEFSALVSPAPVCGYLTVPENRAEPDGPTLRIHVAIYKSTAADPEPDPVIHLVGGPGGSLLDTVEYYMRRGGSDIRERRDYILFNQRGTHYSGADLYCWDFDRYLWEGREGELSFELYNEGSIDALSDCVRGWQAQGIDLAAYNSAEIAADVNDLRLALGYEKVNLYGVSYGARLALTLMRDYPEGIRSVIIDSVYPPQVSLDRELGLNADRALDMVFSTCAADASCAERFGDLEAEFYAVIDRLAAEPAWIELEGPYRYDPYTVRVDEHLFIDAIFGSLYAVDNLVVVPRMISAAYDGNYAAMQVALTGAIGSSLSHGMHFSVQCREEVPFEERDAIPPEAAELPEALQDHYDANYELYRDVCAVWDIEPGPSSEAAPVISDIPTLVFAGAFDPVTPPRWAESTAQSLSRHYLYTFPNVGHGVMRSDDCALQIGLSFLDAPDTAPDSSCIDALGPPQFR